MIFNDKTDVRFNRLTNPAYTYEPRTYTHLHPIVPVCASPQAFLDLSRHGPRNIGRTIQSTCTGCVSKNLTKFYQLKYIKKQV